MTSVTMRGLPINTPFRITGRVSSEEIAQAMIDRSSVTFVSDDGQEFPVIPKGIVEAMYAPPALFDRDPDTAVTGGRILLVTGAIKRQNVRGAVYLLFNTMTGTGTARYVRFDELSWADVFMSLSQAVSPDLVVD